jgi:hypothetical protein
VPDRLDASLGLRLDLAGRLARDHVRVISVALPVAARLVQARPLRGLPLVVHAGFARHAARTACRCSLRRPERASAEVYRWTDPNRDGLFQPAERAAAGARRAGRHLHGAGSVHGRPAHDEFTAGSRSTAAAPASRSPACTHGRAAFRRRSTSACRARAIASDWFRTPAWISWARTTTKLLRVYDRDPADVRPGPLPAHHTRKATTSPSEGVELALELSREGLRLRLGRHCLEDHGRRGQPRLPSHRERPGLPGELFDNPNADSFACGRMFFDRAYTLKLAGVLRRGAWGAGSRRATRTASRSRAW